MTTDILTVDQLTKRFNDQDAVYNASFSLKPGEIVAVKGQAGAGRTTLLKLIAGIMVPTSGTVRIHDQLVIPGDKSHMLKMGIVLRQQGVYRRLTVRQYLMLFSKLYDAGIGRVDEVIRGAGLLDRQDEYLIKFSENFVARVEIARAILHRPSLLLLDEPTAHLDLETMEVLRKLIMKTAEEGTAVLFTTSSHEEAVSISGRSCKIHRGRIDSWESSQDWKPVEGAGEASLEERQFPVRENHYIIEKIPAKVNDRIILFNPLELTYIESQEGTSVLHTGGDEYQCPLTLNELEEKLKPFGFFRSHRSYIVNLQRVREVIPWTRNSYSLVLDDTQKTTIPLSKNSAKDLEGILGM